VLQKIIVLGVDGPFSLTRFTSHDNLWISSPFLPARRETLNFFCLGSPQFLLCLYSCTVAFESGLLAFSRQFLLEPEVVYLVYKVIEALPSFHNPLGRQVHTASFPFFDQCPYKKHVNI